MELSEAGVLVSGGGSGLGAATARALAAAGAAVTVVDIDAERGSATATEVGGLFVRADVSNESDVAAAVTAATSGARPPLRLAVSCAGVGYAGRIVDRDGVPHPLDAFQKVVQVNLVGTFNVIRYAAAAMQKTARVGPDEERGLILNTASVAATEGQIGQVAYSAAKGGIAAMTVPVARDLAVAGIRVCAIVPGTMDTPLFGRASPEMKAALAKDVLFPKRMGTADEFAQLVLAVARIPYINAEVLRLDGGLRMPPR